MLTLPETCSPSLRHAHLPLPVTALRHAHPPPNFPLKLPLLHGLADWCLKQLPCLPPAVARNRTNGTQSIRRFTNVYQKQADGKWNRAVSHVSYLPNPEAAIPALRKMNVTSKAAIPAPSKETVKSKAAMVKQVGTRPPPDREANSYAAAAPTQCQALPPVLSVQGAACAVLTSVARPQAASTGAARLAGSQLP